MSKAALAVIAMNLCSVQGPALETPSVKAQGGAALMLAVLVGPYAHGLSAAQSAELKAIGEGRAKPDAPIRIDVQKIICRAGNVDITHHSCDITVGKKLTHLTGRKAHELYATLLEAGVQPEGAAGTIYAQVKNLKCEINPRIIADKAGGGAKCSWEQE